MSARRLLRLVLLVQCAAALLVAWALLGHGTPGWLALPAGVGAVALVRLLINMNNFVLSALFASPTPSAHRLGLGARVRMLALEYRASMVMTSWLMARASAATRIYPDSAQVPVLLLHGYGANSGYWAHLTPLLDAARTSHATVDLEPVAAGIDDYAPLVERHVQALCAATGASRVAIVAHSMGGLVARAWLRAYGRAAIARVARVVTLGTPHHGTAMARFGLGLNAAQMRPGGEWLRALAAGEDAATRALIISIYSHHDNIVAPQTSSMLPGARNVELGGVGHVALGRDPRVLAAIMRELSLLSVAAGR
ncbi:triacylglycerol lipase [Massilia sp. 9096]|uniref:esterase/lipase family protein n=1 Tax=Massilia sp. 9096 TaxID=1500894 RepID=UPI0005638B41|nr:alpha/beta fold hydrolase [Massilia sp. 9096]